MDEAQKWTAPRIGRLHCPTEASVARGEGPALVVPSQQGLATSGAFSWRTRSSAVAPRRRDRHDPSVANAIVSPTTSN